MKITILAFGIIKDIFKNQSLTIELPNKATVATIKSKLEAQFPQLRGLASYMLAVNNEYATANTPIKSGDEVAIIPPVSGG